MTAVSHELWMNSVLGRELEEGEARELFLISTRESFNKDDLLFRQGDASKSLYLIVVVVDYSRVPFFDILNE